MAFPWGRGSAYPIMDQGPVVLELPQVSKKATVISTMDPKSLTVRIPASHVGFTTARRWRQAGDFKPSAGLGIESPQVGSVDAIEAPMDPKRLVSPCSCVPCAPQCCLCRHPVTGCAPRRSRPARKQNACRRGKALASPRSPFEPIQLCTLNTNSLSLKPRPRTTLHTY